MLESFIITFRETLEAALIVGIVLAYLKKTQRDNLNRHVYSGTILAVVASIIGAIVLQILYKGQETTGQQLFEGTVMIIAAVFVTSMIIWMWVTAKNLKKHIEIGIDERVKRGVAGIGILLFVFLMVFREGAETVLFLYAISFSSNVFSNIIGGIFGILLAIIFGILIMKGSVMVDLKRFFTVTGALLLFLVAELIAVAIHEFQEARLLGSAGSGILWDIQIWLASPNSSLITLLPFVIIPTFMIFLTKKKEDMPKNELKSLVMVKFMAGFFTILVVLFALSSVAAREPGYNPVPIRISDVKGEIKIPVENVNENITKYVYNFNGVDVRFLLIKGSNGEIKSALDACRVCGPMGFEQFEDTLVCRRCGVETEIDDIGKDVSCNPIPLESKVDSGYVIIKVDSFSKDIKIWTDY